jgi:hypothetical protein
VGSRSAAFLTAWREKKLRGVVLAGLGAGGNAATRIETLATRGGMYAYGALRVEGSALTLIPSYPYAAPYEELKLKAR